MTQTDRPHVTEWGSGPQVVLIHGGTPEGGAQAFAAQKPLESRWRLILPDRPGHGLTPKNGREDFERDAGLIAPLLGAGGAHLVGHSYGGMVALVLAVRHPHAVKSLTLIEPPAFCFARTDPAVIEMQLANERVFNNPPSDPTELLQAFFALVGIDARLPDPLPEPLVRLAAEITHIRGPYEAEIDVADINAGGYPVCVLTSGRIEGFEAIAGAIASQTHGEHIVVAGTDHAVQNAGDTVNQILEQIWSGERPNTKSMATPTPVTR
ncbi:MAG: hypothetical protein NVS3B21_11360 [Acidimicrobiales bacterium]